MSGNECTEFANTESTYSGHPSTESANAKLTNTRVPNTGVPNTGLTNTGFAHAESAHSGSARLGFGRAARVATDRAAQPQQADAGVTITTHTAAGTSTRVLSSRPSRLNLLLERVSDRLPVTLQGRWRLDRRSGTALAIAVALVAVVLGGWTIFRAQSQQVGQPRLLSADHPTRPRPYAAPPGQGQAADSAAPAPTPLSAFEGAPPSSGIVIDVEGKVAKPGVIHLPIGARVMDALRAAGGALPGTDLLPLNQARVLNDGEQLLVGAPPGADSGIGGGGGGGLGAPPATSAHSGRGKVPPAGPVHLNTATADELEQLPGVGPALAQRILDWRTQHGRFASIGELQQVHGLGPAKFAALRPWVTP